jgi:hypothetical protein
MGVARLIDLPLNASPTPATVRSGRSPISPLSPCLIVSPVTRGRIFISSLMSPNYLPVRPSWISIGILHGMDGRFGGW